MKRKCLKTEKNKKYLIQPSTTKSPSIPSNSNLPLLLMPVVLDISLNVVRLSDGFEDSS